MMLTWLFRPLFQKPFEYMLASDIEAYDLFLCICLLSSFTGKLACELVIITFEINGIALVVKKLKKKDDKITLVGCLVIRVYQIQGCPIDRY